MQAVRSFFDPAVGPPSPGGRSSGAGAAVMFAGEMSGFIDFKLVADLRAAASDATRRALLVLSFGEPVDFERCCSSRAVGGAS